MNEKTISTNNLIDKFEFDLESIKQEISEHNAKRATQNISRERVRIDNPKFTDDFGWLLDSKSDKEK